MIYIERTPKDLDFIQAPKFSAKLKEEFERAKEHFTAARKTGSIKFECYKHPEIKNKLIELFKGKCAYCDSSITHITAGDIEHFRPKSAYWWLACDWNNLLFACEKCNRTGKNDAFPLLSGASTKCTYTDPESLADEDRNERLLLNPCVENPETYLAYDEATGVICPQTRHLKDSKDRRMAETSIDVYRLQRRELVQEREKVLILLLAQIDYTRKVIENYNQVSGFTAAVKKQFEQKMKEEMAKLLRYNDPGRPYLGMVRQVLRKFFNENGLALPPSLM